MYIERDIKNKDFFMLIFTSLVPIEAANAWQIWTFHRLPSAHLPPLQHPHPFTFHSLLLLSMKHSPYAKYILSFHAYPKTSLHWLSLTFLHYYLLFSKESSAYNMLLLFSFLDENFS